MSKPNNNAEYEYYKRIKLLGEGAFGKAFLVECVEDKSLWVVKQMEMKTMSDEEKKETLKEAKILEALNHPNIVKFKEVYKTKKGRLCIVMEYANGGDLSKKIKDSQNNYFNESQILDWFVQICLAIKHVHDRKIIHRDLKGQNIFLTSTNLIKLGDFGIARVLNKTQDKAKTMVGTPYYLSPEIIEGKSYSFATDIWSLGVILYELCALKPPFNADSLHFLALKIVSGKFNPVPTKFSPEIKQLISSMLSIDPNKRPTISQLLKTPIIMKRINNYLTESQHQYEFSHTVLHKQKFVNQNVRLADYPTINQELPLNQQMIQKKDSQQQIKQEQNKQEPNKIINPVQNQNQAQNPNFNQNQNQNPNPNQNPKAFNYHYSQQNNPSNQVQQQIQQQQIQQQQLAQQIKEKEKEIERAKLENQEKLKRLEQQKLLEKKKQEEDYKRLEQLKEQEYQKMLKEIEREKFQARQAILQKQQQQQQQQQYQQQQQQQQQMIPPKLSTPNFIQVQQQEREYCKKRIEEDGGQGAIMNQMQPAKINKKSSQIQQKQGKNGAKRNNSESQQQQIERAEKRKQEEEQRQENMKKKIEENRQKRIQDAEKLRQEQEEKEQKRENERLKMIEDIKLKKKMNQNKEIAIEWIGQKNYSNSTEENSENPTSAKNSELSEKEENQNQNQRPKWNVPQSKQNKNKDIPVEIFYKEKKNSEPRLDDKYQKELIVENQEILNFLKNDQKIQENQNQVIENPFEAQNLDQQINSENQELNFDQMVKNQLQKNKYPFEKFEKVEQKNPIDQKEEKESLEFIKMINELKNIVDNAQYAINQNLPDVEDNNNYFDTLISTNNKLENKEQEIEFDREDDEDEPELGTIMKLNQEQEQEQKDILHKIENDQNQQECMNYINSDFAKLESLRIRLENSLGQENFIKAYNILNDKVDNLNNLEEMYGKDKYKGLLPFLDEQKIDKYMALLVTLIIMEQSLSFI